MLAVLRHSLYLVLAFVLQTTWLHELTIGAVRPDLVLLAVVFIALVAGPAEATVLGFAIGLCQDAYAPQDLGLNALANCLVGFAVGIGRGGVLAEAVQVQLAALFAAVLVHDLVFYVGASGVSMSEVPYLMLRFGLGRAVYTTAVGLLVAWLLRLRREWIPA